MALSIADQIALDDALVGLLRPSFAAVINKCLCGNSMHRQSSSLSSSNLVVNLQPKELDYAIFSWEDFHFKIEKQNALTNEDIRNSESYKEYYAMASGTIPPKTKGSKKKANTDAIPKRKPPTAPKEKKSGTGKQKTTELEKIPEADLTEAQQLKIAIKRSRQETHSSHASGSGADEGTGVKPGVPDAPDYDSEDDISWKSTDDDQDDEQDQDDDDAEKHDVHETTQEEEDDDDHTDDENDQEDDDANDDDKKADNDDDEELTESENDGDDFVHPKLTTHDDEIIHEKDTDEDDSSISSSDEEDSDNDVEGADVAGAKSDKDAKDEQDQGNEAVKDTNTDLDGRDKVMTDVEDTHVTLTPVNPDGQQQSSSVSSGFVSNMLNPNQDTGVDDIFRQNTEATSFIDTNINRPPTPHPIIIQPQQQPIMTPATTTSSLLQNLPNFASLFGFDHRLKALEDNFSELKQTNQYAEALSSIPSTVDQYLAHKMQEAVDVAVQLKYDRIREESSTANQQFLETIDDGMKKIIKEHVKKGRQQTAGPTTDTDVAERPADQEFETVLSDEQAEEEVQHLPDWFQKPTRLPSPDHAWNTSVPAVHETVQPCTKDDALYKFKEGDLHRLRIQDIEDMLLLLVQGKVTNLSVEERIAFNVSLRMFTRRVVIQRRVEDLQLGVESYQKKLNLTKPDTYRSNLRRQDAYTPYSDPRGFIYENKELERTD
ncbi:hypothetical protein Tco_0424483 [Tanacetum coccineum]